MTGTKTITVTSSFETFQKECGNQCSFCSVSRPAVNYEPRSQKCLNLLSTRELSNKSQNCLYKVSNQFLIWSQTCLKIWDNFETWKGLSYNLVSIADYASRRPSPPGGLVPPSRRTSQVAIVLAPAVVIELQKCCLERDFPHKMKAFKACEFIHSSFLFRLKLIIIPQFSFV